MRIRVTYFGETVDEYPIEDENRQHLLDHFWDNPNVKSVAFIRDSKVIRMSQGKCKKCGGELKLMLRPRPGGPPGNALICDCEL